ncbi:MAG TPA: potassium transporter KefB [Nitrospiraceae bacterium]|nr:potassium transporter KefB [Nitrospiraceae bacterium]
MQEHALLKLLVIIFGVSAAVVFLLNRLKIPSIVGFLIAGVFMGPHGFGIIKDIHSVELLAEIGVILLLFMIGLELSFKNMMMLRSTVLGGGLSQVLLTSLAATVISYPLLGKFNVAIFVGFLVAMSSTAIIMKMLLDRAELDSPHGRIAVGISIFQDLSAIPFMLLIPILAGNNGDLAGVAITMAKAAAIIVAVIFGARWLVPQILHQIAHTRSRELFVITIILLCLGTALLTSRLGLSLALGAFLAGLIISESEYAYQAISDILPFKESFVGLFFISVGMLMNPSFLGTNLITVISVVIIIIFLKAFIVFISILFLGYSPRVAMQTGLYLAQIGEFSFVLATAGRTAGLITDNIYQIFLSASVMTMVLTPFIISTSPALSIWLTSKRILNRLDRMKKKAEIEGYPRKKTGHVIIIGFGLNGRNLARVLRDTDIPYVVLELNNTTVRTMKKKGEPIYYGDGSSPEMLHKLGIATAKVLVIAISDPASTRRIVQIARRDTPRIHIIVRTRYTSEVEDLIKLGADEVIPEEFETSIEIFAKVLHHYQAPRNLISEHIENIRSDSYRVLRKVELPRQHLTERHEVLSKIETETFLIKDKTHASGRSLAQLSLCLETGATVIAVRRDEKLITNPDADFVLELGDVVYLIGRQDDISRAFKLLEKGKP